MSKLNHKELKDMDMYWQLVKQDNVIEFEEYCLVAVLRGHTINVYETVTGNNVDVRSIGDFSKDRATIKEFEEWADDYREELADME